MGCAAKITYTKRLSTRKCWTRSFSRPSSPSTERIKPMKAVFDKDYIKNLDGKNIKEAATKYDLALALMEDIENFKRRTTVPAL